MKHQKSNDGIQGLFFLEPCYTLRPVCIDKSSPIHTSSQFSMLLITVSEEARDKKWKKETWGYTKCATSTYWADEPLGAIVMKVGI
jgi:hypothetical protein